MTTIADINIAAMAEGYIQCALFADCMPDCDCEPGECGCESGGVEMTGLTVSDEDRAAIERYVGRFVAANLADVREYLERHGGWSGPADSMSRDSYSAEECFGHDLRYTTGGHGAGFWDRDLGDLGERLTAACKGEFDNCGGGDVWQEGDMARFDIRD